MKFNLLFNSVLTLSLLLMTQASHALPWNMSQVDSNPATGFEIYRSSVPSADDIKQWCALGITEVYVLSGDAAANELANYKACPTLKVVYNIQQRTKIPLTSEFLDQFDNWVKDAQATGKKILFRCSCGCHRTGRLAAYYRMKFNGWDVNQAWNELRANAKWMIFFPYLDNEVWALSNYVKKEQCGEKWKYCVWSENTGEVVDPTEDTDTQRNMLASDLE